MGYWKVRGHFFHIIFTFVNLHFGFPNSELWNWAENVWHYGATNISTN